MQDFVCAISCVLFPVLLGPVSAIHVNYPFPACFVTVDNWRLLPALATVVSAALEPGNWTLEEEFMVTPSSTSSGTLRINHPRQPGALCGLGSCATTRLNPLLFTMQDFVCAISCVLFPVLLGPVSAIHVNYPFPACFVTVDNWRLLPALATVVSAALEPGNWTLEEEFMVTPSSTSSGTLRINHPRQPGALCGLGSCATTRLNPLLFTMQDRHTITLPQVLSQFFQPSTLHRSRRSHIPPHGPSTSSHPTPFWHHYFFCIIFLPRSFRMEWPSPRHCFNHLSITFYSKCIHIPVLLNTCGICNISVQPTPYVTPPCGVFKEIK
ncbi:uncharacterized protein [Dermacentor albipictus]|uniref:uncharacterized protein n=1 Tax=Dermacentor albipictus TaxID=60249 RepID=UPI0031FBA919